MLIHTISNAVICGIGFLLFKMFTASGLRTVVENDVNLLKNRNLVMDSVTLVIGNY